MRKVGAEMPEAAAAKRVAVLAALTGFGRNGLAVAAPSLSSMGFQVCQAATALLSAHPMFPGYRFTPVSALLRETVTHWLTLTEALPFSAVLTGCLPDAEAVDAAALLLQACKGLRVVDPVLGDHGKLYRFYATDMPGCMAGLLAQADLCTPNFTEAWLLLGGTPPFNEDAPLSPGAQQSMMAALHELGPRWCVVTSVPTPLGLANLVSDGKTLQALPFPQLPVSYPGCGDLFTAVLTGTLLEGASLFEAVQRAGSFASLAVAHTLHIASPPREGLQFESLLEQLSKNIN